MQTAQSVGPVPTQLDALARDRALVERLCNDDPAAIDELLGVRCGAVIRYFARRYAYEDLPNALYLHLKENDWRNLRTWQGRASLPGWIKQVALNLCRAQLKGIAPSEPLEKVEKFISADRGGSDGNEATIRRLDLLKAIRALPARERFLIIRHVIHDRPISEVAEHLGVTREYADLIKHRAVKHLREYMLGKGGRS